MTNKTIERRYVTVQEAAEYLGVCDRSVRRYIARGEITGHRLPGGKLLRIDLDELDRVIQGGA
ncbi:helix-turn-helix domain-containing protein [Rhodococcus pyridinivorans]